MNHYTTTLLVPSAPETAYQAITANMSDWWTPMSQPFKKTGDFAKTRFSGNSYWVFKATTLQKPDLIRLECCESNMVSDGLEDPHEWLGTTLEFVITPSDEGSRVQFTHYGLTTELECFDICKAGWDHYLTGSLKNYLNNQKGQPNSY